MKPLSPAEVAALRREAAGPFSYVEGDRFTASTKATFCASTYARMMELGWVEEVIL